MNRIVCNNREEWLEKRHLSIGASEISAVLGLSNFQTNVDLWMVKTGAKQAAELSANSRVTFGKESEKYVRGLFTLEHPEMQMGYHEFDILQREDKPWMTCTLDGELTDENGKRGVWECKTVGIDRPSAWKEWDGAVKESYYCQILWQMAITQFDFAILTAYFRYKDKYGNPTATIRNYRWERDDLMDDIAYIEPKGDAFWKCVEERKKPPLILPGL